MRPIDADELYRAKFHGVAEIVPPDEHSPESYKRGWNDAIDAIADKSCTPTIEPEQTWIPCSERLPEEERQSYWVCTDTYYQFECRWTNSNPIWTNLETEWHWNIFDVPQYSKVVAWRKLPEPYRCETEMMTEDNDVRT